MAEHVQSGMFKVLPLMSSNATDGYTIVTLGSEDQASSSLLSLAT